MRHESKEGRCSALNRIQNNPPPRQPTNRLFQENQAPLYPIPTDLTNATAEECYVACSLDVGLSAPFWFGIVGDDLDCVCSTSSAVIYDATASVRGVA